MKYLVYLGILASIIGFSNSVLAVTSDVLFVEPKCQSLPAQFFCTDKDARRIKEDAGVIRGIQEALKQLDENPILDVKIAHYIFDDRSTADYLCAQHNKRRFTLALVLQARFQTSPMARNVQKTLANCFGDDLSISQIGCDVMKNRTKCPKYVVNTMHLKVIEISRAIGGVQAIVSSGNIGRGMYANLEDWVWFSPLLNNGESIHACMWKVLASFSLSPPTKAKIRSDYVSCKGLQSTEVGGIKFQFIPAETDEFFDSFFEQSRKADLIEIFSMDFSDQRLGDALRFALARGARVRFIVDDDWYYSSLKNVKVGTAKVGESVLMNAIAREWPEQVDVRYIETNHYEAPFFNSVHHKMAVFTSNEMVMVLTGSMNLNSGALYGNIDSAYWINEADLVKKYQSYISRIVAKSKTRLEMPSKEPSPVKLQ